MIRRIAQSLPTRESIQANRWLRWMGPALAHPRLWHMSRKGIAAGLALGLFFGLLVPIAQSPWQQPPPSCCAPTCQWRSVAHW